jgi:hypothetical protein
MKDKRAEHYPERRPSRPGQTSRLFRQCVSLPCLIAALSVAGGVARALDCPQIAPGKTPVWVDILSNNLDSVGSPGASFMFAAMQGSPRTPGQSLPFTAQIPPSAIGAYDTDVFPGGPAGPFYSNSSGASVNCFPGIDASLPGGCPSGQIGEGCLSNGDCSGRPILRTPASGIVSSFAPEVIGIDYLGTFDGAPYPEPGSITQVVFFHQNADYLAQMEYGFYRDPSLPNEIVFYWQTHANCTLRPNTSVNDTMCTTERGNRQPSTYIYADDLIPPGNSPAITTTCAIDLGPAGGFGLYYYSMWLFSDTSDGGTWKFGMSILDPTTFQPVVPETSIDPNAGASSPWFPVDTLIQTGGYVTAGITRFDPFDHNAFSFPAPSMSMQRLVVGVAPQ